MHKGSFLMRTESGGPTIILITARDVRRLLFDLESLDHGCNGSSKSIASSLGSKRIAIKEVFACNRRAHHPHRAMQVRPQPETCRRMTNHIRIQYETSRSASSHLMYGLKPLPIFRCRPCTCERRSISRSSSNNMPILAPISIPPLQIQRLLSQSPKVQFPMITRHILPTANTMHLHLRMILQTGKQLRRDKEILTALLRSVLAGRCTSNIHHA